MNMSKKNTQQAFFFPRREATHSTFKSGLNLADVETTNKDWFKVKGLSMALE